MFYYLKYLLAATILLPAIIGCIRFRKMDPAYYPFLICIILAAVNEIITFLLANAGFSSAYFFNTYSFIESILLFVQFMLWRTYRLVTLKTIIGVLTITLFYVVSMFIISSGEAESIFMIGYAILLLILSLNEISHQLITTTNQLVKNANILIPFGLIIFYTYAIFIEVFWWYSHTETSVLSSKIYDIIPFINFFVNLIFAYAILWIPRKQNFILQ